MKNKGFTLMEALVAIFIGSMVTVALLSMWKASSTQTSQAQRQTVIRNELSMFLRSFYIDFVQSDEIICPSVVWGSSAVCEDGLFVGVTHATIKKSGNDYLVERNVARGSSSWTGYGDEPTRREMYVAYRLNTTDGTIERCSGAFLADNTLSRTSANVSSVVSAAKSCQNSTATVAMPYVAQNGFKVEQATVGSVAQSPKPDYKMTLVVYKEFDSGVPPIRLDFERFYTKLGGV